MESAPIYKTAEELGIEEVTRQGLIQLARDLVDGSIPAERFDMLNWCGSACCIGGHLWGRNELGDIDGDRCTRYDHPLEPLFYPTDSAIYCCDPLKGARAIVNFLVTGDPQWNLVMAEPTQP